MDAAIAVRALQQFERAPALFRRQARERFRGADYRSQLHFRRPVSYIGDITLDAVGQSRLLGGVHYALQRLDLTIDSRHIATMCRQIESGTIDVAARNQHFGFCRRAVLTRAEAQWPASPTPRRPRFLEHLVAFPPPCSIGRGAVQRPAYAIEF